MSFVFERISENRDPLFNANSVDIRSAELPVLLVFKHDTDSEIHKLITKSPTYC